MSWHTSGLGVQVGRPRPNFFYRCFPDGEAEWHDRQVQGVEGLRDPDCHPKQERDVIDGYKSFPSGVSLRFIGFVQDCAPRYMALCLQQDVLSGRTMS